MLLLTPRMKRALPHSPRLNKSARSMFLVGSKPLLRAERLWWAARRGHIVNFGLSEVGTANVGVHITPLWLIIVLAVIIVIVIATEHLN